ncbi:uncharacterized protein METZ01_LOCUS467635, partial [marine metagenome]
FRKCLEALEDLKPGNQQDDPEDPFQNLRGDQGE